MTEKKRKLSFQMLFGFFKRMQQDHVSAYASQAAYFLIMSFIPFVLFLTTIVQYTPLTYGMVREAILSVVPQNLQGFVLSIVAEVYTRSSAVLPVSALVALWSSGKCIQALTRGLNTIYHVQETRNWLISRIYSVIYTFLFVVAIVVCLLLLVLGNRLHELVLEYIPFVGIIIGRILSARTFLVFVVLFFIFLILYRFVPNRKATLKSQAPGAFLTAVAWSLFSYFFSLYFSLFPGFANMYGSLATIILAMLWLFVCMNLLLYGAEVNAYFEKELREAKNSMVKKLAGK